MKSRLFNVLIPMIVLAATAIPSDPAKAEVTPCLRATSAPATPAAPQKTVKTKAAVDKPRKEWRLEAI
jgi:hypothetical protein